MCHAQSPSLVSEALAKDTSAMGVLRLLTGHAHPRGLGLAWHPEYFVFVNIVPRGLASGLAACITRNIRILILCGKTGACPH